MWLQLAIFFLSFPAMACAIGLTEGHPVGPWLALNTLLFALLWVASTLWHELGHVSFAALVGMRSRLVVIGAGRPLATWRSGRLTVRLHAIPAGGFAFAEPVSGAPSRLQFFVCVLGGPLFTALLLGLGLALSEGRLDEVFWAFGFTHRPVVAELLVSVNAILLAANLVPIPMPSVYGKTYTDGYQLCAAPFWKSERLAELAALPFLVDVSDALLSGDRAAARAACERGLTRFPRNFLLRQSAAAVAMMEGRFAEGRVHTLALLDEPLPDESMRPVLENNVAWATLHLGDAMLEEADALSKRALGQLPKLPAVMNTRAGVLLRRGQLDEAEPLLERAYQLALTPIERATIACHRGMLAASRGQQADATRWLERARQEDPHCTLLEDAAAWCARPGAV